MRTQKALKPKKWTKQELETVKRLLRKGFSNKKISLELKGKSSRDVASLLSQESPF